MSDQPKAAATGAGRGVLYIAFAKFYFLFTGLFVQFRLPNILSRTTFGAYQLVSNVASIANNVLVTGTIQAVSKFTAAEPEKARRVELAGLRMHVRVGLPIAIAFIAAAPLVAMFMKDSEKTTPLMLAGLIVGGYSFYAVFVGTANGLREFHKQAGLDITFATLRTAGLVGMAMAGFGVAGVVGGWVAAVGVILCAAIVWVGLPGTSDKLPMGPMMRFFGGVAVYLALFNLLMFADSLLVKRLTTDYFAAHASDLQRSLDQVVPWAAKSVGYHFNPSGLADVQNAYYGTVQNMARISYQAIIAATFVVFPLVSRSTFTEDKDTTRRYVEVTTRYSLMFALAIAVVMAANPADVLGLVYAPDYAERGGSALAILAFGYAGFAVFAVAGTILNGAGYTRDAIWTAAITLVIAVAGNWIAIPMATGGDHVLEAAATVTAGAMIIGALLTGFALWRRLGAFLPIVSVIRLAIAAAAGVAVGRVLPLHGKLMTLVEAAVVGVVFLVVLVVTRELGARDLEAIRAVRRKRAAGGGEP